MPKGNITAQEQAAYDEAIWLYQMGFGGPPAFPWEVKETLRPGPGYTPGWELEAGHAQGELALTETEVQAEIDARVLKQTAMAFPQDLPSEYQVPGVVSPSTTGPAQLGVTTNYGDIHEPLAPSAYGDIHAKQYGTGGKIYTGEPGVSMAGLPVIGAALAGIGAGIITEALTGVGIDEAISGFVGQAASEFVSGTMLGGDKLMSNGTGTALVPVNGDFMLGGVYLQGPGVKEPPPAMVAKHWTQRFDSPRGDTKVEYWILVNGTWVSYNHRTGRYKKWRPQKMAVIGKNMPSHKMITRLRHNLSRHAKDAETILKLTKPHRIAQPKRRRYRARRP